MTLAQHGNRKKIMDNIQNRDVQVGIEMGWHGKTIVKPLINRSTCEIDYPMEIRRLASPFPGQPDTPFYAVFSLDDCLPIGGTVSKGYKLFSNERMIDMVESALGGTSHQIVSVGTVADRSKVFASVKLDDNFNVAGRDTASVLNILWGHGGKFSILARTGFTVVVCENTFSAAIRDKKNKGQLQLRLKHTGNAEEKLGNMEAAIEGHVGVVAEFKAAMAEMHNAPCKVDTARETFAGFVVRDTEVKAVGTRTANRINRLTDLFQNGRGNKGETYADTFNALTDLYTHESSGGDNMQKQYESSEFGSGERNKAEAYDLLTGKDVKGLGDLATVQKRGARVLQLV